MAFPPVIRHMKHSEDLCVLRVTAQCQVAIWQAARIRKPSPSMEGLTGALNSKVSTKVIYSIIGN